MKSVVIVYSRVAHRIWFQEGQNDVFMVKGVNAPGIFNLV